MEKMRNEKLNLKMGMKCQQKLFLNMNKISDATINEVI